MRSLTLSRTLKDMTTRPAFVPVFLLLVSILSYGLLIPWLHLYIDDWIWFWTWEKFGAEGITRYFSTNRPAWGLIYQATLPLLTQTIVGSHIFALLMRWFSGLAGWWLLRLLWPGHSRIALYGALIFLVYPGFALQSIALTYGHIFLVYTAFLLSLCFNLLALRRPQSYLLYTTAACLLSLVNLATLEFFFTLELIRPVLLAVIISEKESGVRRLMAATIRHWLPYLTIFAGVVIWRAFFFQFQTYNHPILLLSQLKTNPVNSLVELSATILQDIFETSLGAWLPALQRLAGLNFRQISSLATLALSVVLLVLVTAALLASSPAKSSPASASQRRLRWQLTGIGLVSLLAAGWPFWLTRLEVRPLEFNSRMTLPFILGAALLITGMLEWIASNRLRAVMLAVAVAIACGYHFQVANNFRLDWVRNQRLMWQIAWRIPAMAEGTTLLITDFPVTYYNTATLSTELNQIFPIRERFPDLAYYMLYSRELDRDLEGGLTAGKPIQGSNVSAKFNGSTSQVLAAQFDFGRCFRLLEPDLDPFDETLPEHLRKAAQISNPDWVLMDQPASQPASRLFGALPTEQWCYYFEKADLSRQSQDWRAVTRLWDAAQSASLRPLDEMEKLVFIEAFAHNQEWDRALEISAGFENAEKRPMLCLLWKRIHANTPESQEKTEAEEIIQQTIGCQ